METPSDRRQEVLRETLARFLARGAHADVTRLLGRVRPEDVAAVLERFDAGERIEIFRLLLSHFPDSAGDVLTGMDPARRLELLEELTPEQIAGLLERIPVDDAVFVVESLPPALHDQIVELVDLRELTGVQEQLGYPERSAGRLMDTDLFALPETVTVRDAIAAIQEMRDVEMIFYLYVVDRDRHLIGVTSLRQLLLSRPETTLDAIMQKSVIKVHVETDQEEVARQASRYDLLAIPVVDDHNRLVGIVTVDDIIDVVQEEAADDMLRMAGTSEDELLYEGRVLAVARLRLPSLLVSLAGLLVTGMLLAAFQTRFVDALFLLAFVPAIMGLPGSVGGQASAVALRDLAAGGLAAGSGGVAAFIGRQFKVAAVLGLACGALAAVAALALQRNVQFGLAVGAALLVAMPLAALVGAATPPLLARLNLDPAVASGPLLAAVHDIVGILAYFSVASLLLRHLAT